MTKYKFEIIKRPLSKKQKPANLSNIAIIADKT